MAALPIHGAFRKLAWLTKCARDTQQHTSTLPTLRLARTLYIRCAYGIFDRGITKYTVIYGVYIRLWPTPHMSSGKGAHIIYYTHSESCVPAAARHWHLPWRTSSLGATLLPAADTSAAQLQGIQWNKNEDRVGLFSGFGTSVAQPQGHNTKLLLRFLAFCKTLAHP